MAAPDVPPAPGTAEGWRTEDARILAAAFRRNLGRNPVLDAPLAFSDRMFRLMISRGGMSPLRQLVADKELVKLYVHAEAGERYNIPTFAVLRSERAVDAYSFPRRCVIKPTHMSGHVILHRAGEPVDLDKVKAWLRTSYYGHMREGNYRYLQPKVIVEALLEEPGRQSISDYKAFCFHGVPAFFHVNVDRETEFSRAFYSPRWNRLDIRHSHAKEHASPLPRPARLKELLEVARRLSRRFEFVRVDLYDSTEGVKAGELTCFPGAARIAFDPPEADLKIGRLFTEPQLEIEALLGA